LIQFNFDKYNIAVQIGKEPDIYDMWLKHASFKDIDGLSEDVFLTALIVGPVCSLKTRTKW
jgi:hypothetical protein